MKLATEEFIPGLAMKHCWFGVSIENKSQLWRAHALRKAAVVHRFLSIEPLLEDLGTIDLTGIEWVIVGGESGPNARTMRAEWVRNIRDQCEFANVPFFFKQWGGVSKKRFGRELDGVTYDGTPLDLILF